VKKIEVVIRPSRLDAVRTELARCGVWGQLTLTDVFQGQIDKSSIRNEDGTAVSLDSRIKIELIVGDHQVDTAVHVILRHAVGDPSAIGVDEDHGHLMLLHIDVILEIAPPETENP
jgi:nitrogen regulatory protein PII